MKFLAALLLALLAACCMAQLSPSAPPSIRTLDVLVAESPRIVVGKLASLPNANQWPYRMKVDVEETIRGESAKQIEVTLARNASELGEWQKSGARLLVAAPFEPERQGEALNLSDKELTVLTSDLKLLRDPEKVLAEVRRLTEKYKGKTPPETYSLMTGIDKVAGTSLLPKRGWWEPAGVFYAVLPIGEVMERAAREMLRSKEILVRGEGVRALAKFPTKDNIELLKGMLGDEGWETGYRQQEEYVYRTEYNGVRRTAFEVLRDLLHVQVEPPEYLRPQQHNDQVIAVMLDTRQPVAGDIDDLSRYHNLERLYLSNAKLGQSIGALFPKIAKVKSLKSLFLENSDFVDEDVDVLRELPRLTYVGLGGTRLTDAGLMELIKVKSLKKVDLGDKVTDGGIKEALKVRPDLRLVKDEFGFLSKFGPRRMEVPYWQSRTWFLIYGFDEALFGLRAQALIFPAKTSKQAVEGLKIVLAKNGWKPASTQWPEYARKTAPLGPNFQDDRVMVLSTSLSKIYLKEPIKESEVAVVIVRNVDPG